MVINKTNKSGQPIRDADTKKTLTAGQKAADIVTKVVGSWIFILSLLGLLCVWIIINVSQLIWQPWDPYPFILLNFVLSCLAAIQAPVILMSQNRSAQRDTIRAEYDYMINRKAEREIQDLQKDIKYIKNAIQRLNRTAKDIHNNTNVNT